MLEKIPETADQIKGILVIGIAGSVIYFLYNCYQKKGSLSWISITTCLAGDAWDGLKDTMKPVLKPVAKVANKVTAHTISDPRAYTEDLPNFFEKDIPKAGKFLNDKAIKPIIDNTKKALGHPSLPSIPSGKKIVDSVVSVEKKIIPLNSKKLNSVTKPVEKVINPVTKVAHKATDTISKGFKHVFHI